MQTTIDPLEIRDRRCREARRRLQQQMEFVETLDDPDVLEQADGALADVLYDVQYPRRRGPGWPTR